jgi:orotate phosphoribosyltransferase-like protein
MNCYGTVFYDWNLRKYALAFLKLLPKDVTGLLSSGSSGCAIASAMIALSKKHLFHVYVRKSKEYAHSECGGEIHYQAKYAIVDDMIACGVMVDRIRQFAKKQGGLNISCIILVQAYGDYKDKLEGQIPIYSTGDLQ